MPVTSIRGLESLLGGTVAIIRYGSVGVFPQSKVVLFSSSVDC